jgi:hypothetical protein
VRPRSSPNDKPIRQEVEITSNYINSIQDTCKEAFNAESVDKALLNIHQDLSTLKSDVKQLRRPAVKQSPVAEIKDPKYLEEHIQKSKTGLVPVYIKNVTFPSLGGYSSLRHFLLRMKFQLKHIANIDFLPGNRIQFLVDSNYKLVFLDLLKNHKFEVLDHFDPLLFRTDALSEATKDKIISAEAKRHAKAFVLAKQARTRDYFAEQVALNTSPAFIQHYLSHLKTFQASSLTRMTFSSQ